MSIKQHIFCRWSLDLYAWEIYLCKGNKLKAIDFSGALKTPKKVLQIMLSLVNEIRFQLNAFSNFVTYIFWWVLIPDNSTDIKICFRDLSNILDGEDKKKYNFLKTLHMIADLMVILHHPETRTTPIFNIVQQLIIACISNQNFKDPCDSWLSAGGRSKIIWWPRRWEEHKCDWQSSWDTCRAHPSSDNSGKKLTDVQI